MLFIIYIPGLFARLSLSNYKFLCLETDDSVCIHVGVLFEKMWRGSCVWSGCITPLDWLAVPDSFICILTKLQVSCVLNVPLWLKERHFTLNILGFLVFRKWNIHVFFFQWNKHALHWAITFLLVYFFLYSLTRSSFPIPIPIPIISKFFNLHRSFLKKNFNFTYGN